jgi:hypothetical protein
MAIHRLLQNSAFEPDHIAEIVRAYEAACAQLGLTDRRSDPFTETIAGVIITIAQTGVTSADDICAQALARLAGDGKG